MKTAGKVFLVIAAIIMLNARVFSYSADSVRRCLTRNTMLKLLRSFRKRKNPFLL